MPEKYAVLDESGKVREWLEQGRGLDIWTSHEIGASRPDMLTPHGKGKPHWAYELDRTIRHPDDVTFYRPVGIVQSWHDTPQGNRAAQRALDTKYPDKERTGTPTGTWKSTYTLCHYTMGSIAIRPESEGGTVLRYRERTESVPTLLDVEYRVGILEWSANVSEEE